MSVAGKYKVSAAAPNGNVEIIMDIAESGGAYTGTLSAQNNTSELKNISVDGGSFSCSANITYDYDRFNVTIKGNVDGDAVSGSIITPYMPVSFKGQRI